MLILPVFLNPLVIRDTFAGSKTYNVAFSSETEKHPKLAGSVEARPGGAKAARSATAQLLNGEQRPA